ncbi:MAG: oligosaccharide flippase family protein [Ruminococcus sp.]
MKKEKNQLRIGVILSYVNLILGNLIPVFYTPIMLSLLGQSEYGLYKLASNVTSYLSLISLGLGTAITRYLIKAREEEGKEAEEKILGLFTRIFQVISMIAFVVGVILTLSLGIWYSDSLTDSELFKMKILVFILVCNMALSFLMTPQVSVVTSHERFIFLQSMNILSTCAMPVLNLIVLFLGFASIGMTVSSLALNLVIRIFYYLYMRIVLDIRPIYKGIPKSKIKEIMGFSFWIFVSNVVGQLYNATDTVMIGAIPALATVGVAIYNVGSVFNHIVYSLTLGVSSVLSPKTNKMVFQGASNDELTDLAIRIGRLQCYIITLIVTGFICFGQPFIQFYVGDGYEEAYWVAILMMIPNMIPLVQSICLNIIVAQNKHRFRSLVYLGIAIANVIGTWFLMQIMGIVGAALMTGVALIIGQGIIMNWYYHYKTGLNMVRFWKEVGKIYIIPILMCVVTLIVSKFVDFYNLIVLIIGILVYTLIYCIVNWLFVMNDYEKDIFRSPIKKVLKKISNRG